MKFKLLDSFAGIGATYTALKELNIDVELVGYIENNIYADCCYRAIHGVSGALNLGDIKNININDIPDFNIMNFSFPCKDFSVAGNMKGLKNLEGEITHSGLYFYGMSIIEAKKPQIIISENVRGITLAKFEEEFNEILKNFEDLGYKNYYKVINADRYVPQNRERFIMISILDGEANFEDIFNLKESESGMKLLDVIEDNVDNKYYLNDLIINKYSIRKTGIITHKTKIKVKVRKYEVNTEKLKKVLKEGKINSKLTNKNISKKLDKPLTLVEHWFRQDKSFSIPSDDIWNDLKELLNIDTEEFDKSITEWEEKYCNFDKTNRVYDVNGLAPTLTATSPDEKILLQSGKIRRITPLEAWILMGFKREQYIIAKNKLELEFPMYSESKIEKELYERAGRSIVVPMLVDVLKFIKNV